MPRLVLISLVLVPISCAADVSVDETAAKPERQNTVDLGGGEEGDQLLWPHAEEGWFVTAAEVTHADAIAQISRIAEGDGDLEVLWEPLSTSGLQTDPLAAAEGETLGLSSDPYAGRRLAMLQTCFFVPHFCFGVAVKLAGLVVVAGGAVWALLATDNEEVVASTPDWVLASAAVWTAGSYWVLRNPAAPEALGPGRMEDLDYALGPLEPTERPLDLSGSTGTPNGDDQDPEDCLVEKVDGKLNPKLRHRGIKHNFGQGVQVGTSPEAIADALRTTIAAHCPNAWVEGHPIRIRHLTHEQLSELTRTNMVRYSGARTFRGIRVHLSDGTKADYLLMRDSSWQEIRFTRVRGVEVEAGPGARYADMAQ